MKVDKEKILKLRYQGKSYNEIARALKIGKGTVSYWLHGVPLPPAAQKRIQGKIENARKLGLIAFTRRRSRMVLRENSLLYRKGLQEIGSLSERELFLLGVALYWGEGYKSEKWKYKSSAALRFTNSDPLMVASFVRFSRDILKVSDDQMKAYIHMYPHQDPKKVIRFWSRLTRFPLKSFRVYYYVSRVSNHVRPANSLPYGTLHIRINSRRLFFRMKGWIQGLGKAGSQNFGAIV